jgi:hypothetical protein
MVLGHQARKMIKNGDTRISYIECENVNKGYIFVNQVLV